MRLTLLFAALLGLIPFAHSQGNVQPKGEKVEREREVILERFSTKIADSIESVATKCATAAAPACVSAIAAMPQPPAPEMDKRSADGLLGDYIGGVVGTIIAGITMVAVFLAWWTSRKTDYRAKTYQVFAEMLRTHEEILASIHMGQANGRDAIAHILSEFDFAYRVTKRASTNAGWSLAERLNIAYTYTYYGPKLHTVKVLHMYNPADLTLINDAIALKARSSVRKKGREFKGHQNRLSHYFRNLYSAYSFIESSRLTDKEKKALGKVLRAKLSNYEQALLVLNVLSHLGGKWKSDGLIEKYMPIRNVPEHFFAFDTAFHLKTEFPRVQFEWE